MKRTLGAQFILTFSFPFFSFDIQVRFGDKQVDVLNQFDHVFWFGDLNYRTMIPFHETIKLVNDKE